MAATYADVAKLLPEDGSEPDLQQIAGTLSLNPVTVRPIPKSALTDWLFGTGLLRDGADGWAGWLKDLRSVGLIVAADIDWLCGHLRRSDVQQIRTDTSEQVAAALEEIQEAYRVHSGGIPIPVEVVDAQLLEWTGGRRIGETTVEDVQALLDIRSLEQALQVVRDKCDAAFEAAQAEFRAAGSTPETIVAAGDTAYANWTPPSEPVEGA